ncbi:hypothetical protein HPP92_017293 [Vanilla planifolia]|uniref:glycerophosphodiester phosphodiesterase n=1 Tax=Vanilla planifolia TaxID=51239 RepID=A0A835UPI0_VANPL|nr:hypothetical protein HPP92_017293 [Vanilla planifolia]
MMERGFWWMAAAGVSALLLLLPGTSVAAQKTNASTWQTLRGDVPIVIAKGGFSGLFPDSSSDAYLFAVAAGSPNTNFWCDVRLTKDVVQAIFSRTQRFDGNYPILTVEDVQGQVKSVPLWLNVQNAIFYSQHNLSMRSYILSITRNVVIDYISSPEIGFLTSLGTRLQKTKTKLVFRFLGEDVTEPSTNQTYGTLLKNLTFIKTFASGILVPKHYILPVTSDLYLEPYTSIVTDAHKEGLEIYAGDFVNDVAIPYNYSYDPLAEYLSFIDNDKFSVDGFLTDFPVTPAEAVGCFSHINKSSIDHGKPVIFSHNGASGDYPDCTDLAYQKAVDDGADIIDCLVQVTQDGVIICMSSIDLMGVTTVGQSPFRSRLSTIAELQSPPGIFTFNLTWDEINKNLTPSISNPFLNYNGMVRNPRSKNAGNFMTLSDFLSFAKGKAISGILINIEHAAFLAENIGISVTDGVISALKDAGYNNQTTLDVIIQSSNSSVLTYMKQRTKYKLMYRVDESIQDASAPSITDIKKFADSVAVDTQSIYPVTEKFIVNGTHLTTSLQKAGLLVHVYVLMNEFVSQPWDFFSDPYVQLNSYVQGTDVDGIITDFPASARAYKRNLCRNLGDNTPNYMLPVQVGGLLQVIPNTAQPPALPPLPVLEDSDVVEPSLPPAVPIKPSPPTSSSPPQGNPSAPPSGVRALSPKSSAIVSMVVILASVLFS